jgi:hypothetical protein
LDTERGPKVQPPAPAVVTADQPGPACLYAAELMELATARKTHPHIDDGCPYCKPRFDSLLRLFNAEPAAEAADVSYEPLPPLDAWSGLISSGTTRAAEGAGERVIGTTLAPNPTCRRAPVPLYLELRWTPARTGRVSCQLVFPASDGQGSGGTALGVLDRLDQNSFMFELTAGDQSRTWGFDTFLLWDETGTALVSPPRDLPFKDFGQFSQVVLTHLADAREP